MDKFRDACIDGNTDQAMKILDKVPEDKLQELLFGSEALDKALDANRLTTLDTIVEHAVTNLNNGNVCMALFPYIGVTQNLEILKRRIGQICDKVQHLQGSDLYEIRTHGETILSVACRVSTKDVVSHLIEEIKKLSDDKLEEMVLKTDDTANTILHGAWLNKQGQIADILDQQLPLELMEKLRYVKNKVIVATELSVLLRHTFCGPYQDIFGWSFMLTLKGILTTPYQVY